MRVNVFPFLHGEAIALVERAVACGRRCVFLQVRGTGPSVPLMVYDAVFDGIGDKRSERLLAHAS